MFHFYFVPNPQVSIILNHSIVFQWNVFELTSICIFIYPHFKATFLLFHKHVTKSWVRLNIEIFREKKTVMILISDCTYTPTDKCHHQKEHQKRQKKRRLTFIEGYHSVIHGLLEAHFKIRRIDIDIKIEKENMSECQSVNNGHWTHFYVGR